MCLPAWPRLERSYRHELPPRTAVLSLRPAPIHDRHGTGSLGQWVIWVIFHVRVTGSSFRPGVRPQFSRFSKKMPKVQNVHLKCSNDESHCQVPDINTLTYLLTLSSTRVLTPSSPRQPGLFRHPGTTYVASPWIRHGTGLHFVTQRPSDPGIQRPGDPVDPVNLFYNELQMSTYV